MIDNNAEHEVSFMNEQLEQLIEKALICGFSEAGQMDVSTLMLRPEVREMCAADRCRSYGKSWGCPPYCGTLEEAGEKIIKFSNGIIVQTVGQLEDQFDFESMKSIEQRHTESFDQWLPMVFSLFPGAMPMAAGVCTRCTPCLCPDKPCPFPELVSPSMEAYGLVVSDVCRENGMKYYYGELTISYTSCILVF